MHLSRKLICAGAAGLVALSAIGVPVLAASHREAPAIAFDPSADITDLYAFVSPDKPDTATLIANFTGFQEPGGGPNFYPFNPDVAVLDQGRQHRRRRRGHHLHLPLLDVGREPGQLPVQRLRTHRRGGQQRHPVGHRGAQWRGDPDRRQPSRRPTSARAPRPSTTTSPGLASTSCPTARPCSPASATTRSSRTWRRSSTWAACDRSTTAHLLPLNTAQGQRLPGRLQRQHGRDPGPARDAHEHRQAPGRGGRPQRASSGSGVAPAAMSMAVDGGAGRLGPGLTPGQPADQRGHHPARPEGRLERIRPRR